MRHSKKKIRNETGTKKGTQFYNQTHTNIHSSRCRYGCIFFTFSVRLLLCFTLIFSPKTFDGLCLCSRFVSHIGKHSGCKSGYADDAAALSVHNRQ